MHLWSVYSNLRKWAKWYHTMELRNKKQNRSSFDWTLRSFAILFQELLALLMLDFGLSLTIYHPKLWMKAQWRELLLCSLQSTQMLSSMPICGDSRRRSLRVLMRHTEEKRRISEFCKCWQCTITDQLVKHNNDTGDGTPIVLPAHRANLPKWKRLSNKCGRCLIWISLNRYWESHPNWDCLQELDVWLWEKAQSSIAHFKTEQTSRNWQRTWMPFKTVRHMIKSGPSLGQWNRCKLPSQSFLSSGRKRKAQICIVLCQTFEPKPTNITKRSSELVRGAESSWDWTRRSFAIVYEKFLTLLR